MQINPRFKAPSSPRINTAGLCNEEALIGRSIDMNLSSMSQQTQNFVAAVALFHHCRENGSDGVYADWRFIAARDGTMSLRNFGDALAKVRGLIGKISSWLPLVDTKALKAAEALFNEKFPFAHKHRHSVAHPELYNDPTKKMGIDGSFNAMGIKADNVINLTIGSSIADFTFGATFEGMLVKYDLTAETVQALLEILNQSFDAFAPPTAFALREFPPRK